MYIYYTCVYYSDVHMYIGIHYNTVAEALEYDGIPETKETARFCRIFKPECS